MIKYIILVFFLFIIIRNIFRVGWRKYIIHILIGVDQFGNALLGGYPDETISSRCYRGQRKWYWKLLGKFLEWLDPGHLQAAYNGELHHNNLPQELR